MGWDGDPAIAGSNTTPITAALAAESVVTPGFAPCGQTATLAVIDPGNTVANKLGLMPFGWTQTVGTDAPLVLAEDAAGERYLTSNGVVTTGAWIERHQTHPDTEITFSYRFGSEIREEQALIVYTRYTDNSNRVALRILTDRIQLINVSGSTAPLILTDHYSTPGLWYDVYVRTVGNEILAWVRSENSPFTLEQAVTFTPPLDFRDQASPATFLDTIAHTTTGFLRIGMNTQASVPLRPGAIQFRDLQVKTLACGGMEPVEYTPCADVVISEIYPHVPVPPMCVYTDNEGECEQMLTHPWIELWNRSDEAVDLEGWALSDNIYGHVEKVLVTQVIGPGEFTVIELPDELPGISTILNPASGLIVLTCPGWETKMDMSPDSKAVASSYKYDSVPEGKSLALSSAVPTGTRPTEADLKPGPPSIGSLRNLELKRFALSVSKHRKVRDFYEDALLGAPAAIQTIQDIQRLFDEATRIFQQSDSKIDISCPVKYELDDVKSDLAWNATGKMSLPPSFDR